jgi:hypothetical protein
MPASAQRNADLAALEEAGRGDYRASIVDALPVWRREPDRFFTVAIA